MVKARKIWGIGIEAEFALFHQPTLGKKFVFFDPRRTFTTGQNPDYLGGEVYPFSYLYYFFYKKKPRKDHVAEKIPADFVEAVARISETDLEMAGRSCGNKVVIGGKKDYVYYLLELRTDEAFSDVYGGKKNMEVYVREIQKKISKLTHVLQKFQPEYLRKEKLGKVTLFPYGMSSRIRLRNLNTNKLSNGPIVDNYTGSYHFTFTLPSLYPGHCREQAMNHKFFANLIQWVEPLIMTAYHTSDDRAVGQKDKYTQGSYRVVLGGWGNFGASDIRRIKCLKDVSPIAEINEIKTLYKYAYLQPKWRDNLPFKYLDLLKDCQKIKEQEFPAIGGDLRTPFFTIAFRSEGDWKKLSKKRLRMTPALEIRIFDWFHPKHLGSLGRFLVMLAERSRTVRQRKYVYQDMDWNEAVRAVLIGGWNAPLSEKYITKLGRILDLKLKPKDRRAYSVLEEVNKQLFLVTRKGKWIKILLEKEYSKEPKMPKVNQKSWEFAFVLHLLEHPRDQVKLKRVAQSLNPLKEFRKQFGSQWRANCADVMAFLAEEGIVKIKYDIHGKIEQVVPRSKKKLDLRKIFWKLWSG